MRNKIVLMTSLLLIMMSCSKKYWASETNKFIVTKVMSRENQNENFTTYKVLMPDQTTLGSTEFWFTDSIGKYKQGDTIIFTK